tara:strand:+ start:776 stop:1417 length:642 start_codon:yes stop_codon:yes gene_type:complete
MHSKSKIIVAPVGDYIEDLYVGIREVPTKKVILIVPKERMSIALQAKESLEKFKVPTRIIEIKGFIWEEIFKVIAQIRKYEDGEIMINVSTGDRDSRCAATSAAFVNGLKAFGIKDDGIMMLPVLKFSYYSLLTERKMNLLKMLYEKKGGYDSLESLSKIVKMSLPLVSYHINGNLKSEGLKTMGLVDTNEEKGKIKVKLSFLGEMLLKGYIE